VRASLAHMIPSDLTLDISKVPTAVGTVVPRWAKAPVATQYSSINRSKLYDLAARGEIRSASIRKKGARRGSRVFDLRSIDEFLEKVAASSVCDAAKAEASGGSK
jgi:hypothetical protein